MLPASGMPPDYFVTLLQFEDIPGRVIPQTAKDSFMYKYLFGPVPSRRLGMSLGVDLVPRKVCSLDCVYCEVGKTTKLTTERQEYIPLEKIRQELLHYFENQPDPDYITFSGSGEPMLNKSIGEVLHFIKKHKPHIPVALLTNGTLLTSKELRAEILDVDLLLPSLDAATESVFKKINRPAGELDFNAYIEGLIALSREFTGRIWLEVSILPGYNTEKDELDQLKKIILQIDPEQVQLNSLDRPGTLTDLRGATRTELQEIVDYWKMDNVHIISAAPERKNIQSYRSDIENTILETIVRRPCTLSDLAKILGMHVNEINKYLDVMESEKKIVRVQQDRGIFYQAAEND